MSSANQPPSIVASIEALHNTLSRIEDPTLRAKAMRDMLVVRQRMADHMTRAAQQVAQADATIQRMIAMIEEAYSQRDLAQARLSQIPDEALWIADLLIVDPDELAAAYGINREMVLWFRQQMDKALAALSSDEVA